MHNHSKVIILSIFVSLLLFSNLAYASNVVLNMPSMNIKANADYLVGEPDKPVVLIVHGFLTTNKFHTITSITSELHGEGYSVLIPTLTLGIPLRKSSLKCQSIHTHTLEQDTLEIQYWVNFLKEKGHKNIILLGHSAGSQIILAYLTADRKADISGTILISVFFLGDPKREYNNINLAQKSIKQENNSPLNFNFLFCKDNYFATPDSFLSYQKLTRNFILERLKSLNIPNYTVMGGADTRYEVVGRDWLKQLENSGTQLTVIEGANHFFSADHEFDMNDEIIRIMDTIFSTKD